MLSHPAHPRIRPGPVATCASAAVALVAGAAAPASAATGDDPVVCPPNQVVCIVKVDAPGVAAAPSRASASRPATGTRTRECRGPTGQSFPCHDPDFGSFSSADGCYYQRRNPQPPPSDPAWEGHYPDGAIYQVTCLGVAGTGGGWIWRATPPDTGGGTGPVDAEQLAQQAIRRLELRGAAIGVAPPPSAVGLVHAPIWLWTHVSPQTWGPATATANVPGLSVTATARATRIAWDMGDGHIVTCPGPGNPYREELGAGPSPTCGHTYERSSAAQPGGRYTVTATTTWQITWAGGGRTGSVTTTRTSTTRLRIAELQVVN